MAVGISQSAIFGAKSIYGELPFRGASCILQLQKYPTATVVTLFLAGAVYDAVLWIMLVIRLYRAYVEGQTRLIGVIFKLGLVYFTFVTVMCIVCSVLYMTFPQSKLLIAGAIGEMQQAVGSVLSARFILSLRTYMKDLTIQSMSVPPERIMRMEDELRFAERSTVDEGFEFTD